MSEVHGDSELVSTGPELDYPLALAPRQVTLRDRVTIATLVPFASAEEIPRPLLKYLSDQFNKEIEKGDTYAMTEPIPLTQFGRHWFSNFGVVMLLGDIESAEQTHAMDRAGANWTKLCLGGFHIRPNYPGRSSHVCNGTFIVTDAARNKGVGRLMGEAYLEWAPRLVSTNATCNSSSNTCRDTHMLSSTWYMSPTLHHVAYGIPLASNELDVSPVEVDSNHNQGSLLMQSSTEED
jgi:GNAT superfamily N-acetyltransferase